MSDDVDAPSHARLAGSGWLPIRTLGRGGGGVVLLCINERVPSAIAAYKAGGQDPDRSPLEQLVGVARDVDALAAIKLPHAEMSSPEDKERFRREVDATEQFIHPALIRLIDRDRALAPKWFATEYHRRGNLEESSNRAKYLGEPLSILADIRPLVEALGLVHRRGAVHRDVKPKNIFVGESGNLILGDFGIVAPTPEAPHLTSVEPAHSRDWVPDWVQFGEERKYTTTVDVFALAKVIYYLLAGSNVMASQLARELDVLRARFPDARGLTPTLALLEKCIVDREDKCTIATGSALAREIENILAAESVGPPKQLVFSCLSTHPSSDIALTHLENSDEEPALLPEVARLCRIPLLLTRPTDRLVGRARVRGLQGVLEIEVGDALSHRIALPLSEIANLEVWTDEFVVHASTPLMPGWHILIVRGFGQNVCMSGLVLYAA